MEPRKKSLHTYLKDTLVRSDAVSKELRLAASNPDGINLKHAKAEISGAGAIVRAVAVTIAGYKATGEKFSMHKGM